MATGALLAHLRAVQEALRALPEVRAAGLLVRWPDPARLLVLRLGPVVPAADADRLAGALAGALEPTGGRRSHPARVGRVGGEAAGVAGRALRGATVVNDRYVTH